MDEGSGGLLVHWLGREGLLIDWLSEGLLEGRLLKGRRLEGLWKLRSLKGLLKGRRLEGRLLELRRLERRLLGCRRLERGLWEGLLERRLSLRRSEGIGRSKGRILHIVMRCRRYE